MRGPIGGPRQDEYASLVSWHASHPWRQKPKASDYQPPWAKEPEEEDDEGEFVPDENDFQRPDDD